MKELLFEIMPEVNKHLDYVIYKMTADNLSEILKHNDNKGEINLINNQLKELYPRLFKD